MELVRRLAYSRAKTMYAMRKYKGKSLIDWAVLWFKMSNDAFFRLYGFNFNPFDYPYLYDILQEVPMYKNNEGYPDPTAGRAIRKADKPPEEVINFRRALKLMSVICHVRILGKVTVVDDKGRRW